MMAGRSASLGLHDLPWLLFRPKTTHPFHLVPVISWATDDSDLYGRPRYSKSSIRTVTQCEMLPFPDQLCAGDRSVNRPGFPLGGALGVVLLCHGAEPVEGLPANPAIGQL